MKKRLRNIAKVFSAKLNALLTISLLLALCTVTHPLFSSGKPEETIPKQKGAYSVYGATTIKAGLSFPPFADEKQRDFTIQNMQALSIDRLRIAIDWRNREPQKGSFYWKPMDERMQAAKENNLKVFLTIASVGPPWASSPSGEDGATMFDEDALRGFYEALLSRYDHIAKIQFGNEWEAGSDGYTTGDQIESFVLYTNMLYDAVQIHSPQTEVVLGGLTRLYPIMEYFQADTSEIDLSQLQLARNWSKEDLVKRIERDRQAYESMQIKANVEYVLKHAKYDILDIHLYDDAENWQAYLSVIPKDRPIVVSEFGGPSSEFEQTDPSYHANRMEAYIDAIEKLPITEAYYFKLVDSDESYHKHSGLFNKRVKKKPAYSVFSERLSPRSL